MAKLKDVMGWKFLMMALTLLVLPVMSASAFVDPPTFSPTQPYAGQSVDMSVRAGGCHGFGVPPPGYPYVEVQTSGNVVDVIIAGVEANDPILCIFGVGTITVDIGAFPQGDYTVRVRIRQVNPPFDILPPASEAGLSVLGQPATPVTVPATGMTTLAAFAGLLILLAIAAFKRSTGILAIVLVPVLLASPRIATAQDTNAYIFVEISSEDGTPTPEQIVDDFDVGSGLPPPISALAVENPDLLEYLIPRDYRAQGDFKDYLESNPDLPRARLEQTIIVGYPDGADLDVALAALLADPYVRHANIPEAMELSAPPGGLTGKKGSGNGLAMAKGTATQYWIDAMNFNGAWARAGGWSRVGVIDNGLYTNHSDLRSQNASGALTGGNFLPSASVDLSRHGIPHGTIDFNVDEMEPTAITSPGEVACDPMGTGSIVASFAGHGTHVHGLIAANHGNSDGVVGACKNCGLASVKALRDWCTTTGLVYPTLNDAAVWAGLTILTDTGAQVINMSLGGGLAQNYCSLSTNANKPECLAVAHAHSHGVMMVTASGNFRNTSLKRISSRRTRLR